MASTAKSPELRSPLYAFGLEALAKPADETCGVWANEVTGLGYISLRGNSADPALVAAASAALAVNLPVEPCTFASGTSITAFWLSLDEWMIACPRAAHSGVMRDLEKALAGMRYQVADNSGGYTQAVLTGRNAAEVLAHATVYDIAKLTAGRVVGTAFGKSSLYLYRRGDGYGLLLRRSFADYIWRYLVRAAAPYRFGVAQFGPQKTGVKGGAA